MTTQNFNGGSRHRVAAMRAQARGLALQMLAAGMILVPFVARAERVLNFTGTGAVVLPANDMLRFGAANDFALELWLKPANTIPEVGTIFANDSFAVTSRGDFGGGPGWGLYWRDGALRVARRPSGLSGGASNPIAAPTGTWHHVTVNFDRAHNVCSVYVDGRLAESIFVPGGSTYHFDSANAYRLGSAPDGADNFKGAVDEVRIWSRVRTGAEISRAYQERAALNGDESGLVAYYPFNEASGDALSLGGLSGTSAMLTDLGTGGRGDDGALVLSPPLPPPTDFALSFNGQNQTLETAIPGSALAGNELTIEYWFQGSKLQSAVRLQQGGSSWVVSGWNQPPEHIVNTGQESLRLNVNLPGKNVQDGFWHHVAMTWKSDTSNGFRGYVDGIYAGVTLINGFDQSDTRGSGPIPAMSGNVFLGSYINSSEYLQGTLDEVRIWNRALSAAEILDHATNRHRLVGREPGLVAYFPFNDSSATGTRDEVSGLNALFRNMDSANRVGSLNFADPLPVFAPDPSSAGLWIGTVTLSAVSEVASTSDEPTPTAGDFAFRILFHVDSAGGVRLLKDVTVMQRDEDNDPATPPVIALVSDPTLIPSFQGVERRNGKLAGLRYSASAYDFAPTDVPATGGIGPGVSCRVEFNLEASHPTNPMRHKYHPDLDEGIPLARQMSITFDGTLRDAPNFEVKRLAGSYTETLTGLRKVPIKTHGTIVLNRVSTSPELNPTP